jgi:hypothetical protein
MGVVSAFIIFIGRNFSVTAGHWHRVGTLHWVESAGGEILGFGMFVRLCAYLYWDALRVKNKS